jgi:hypothetical protein
MASSSPPSVHGVIAVDIGEVNQSEIIASTHLSGVLALGWLGFD